MEETGNYWVRLLNEMEEFMASGSSKRETPPDIPRWVWKALFQLQNLSSPKMQIRHGMKLTPDKMGVVLASNVLQVRQAREMANVVPNPPAGAAAVAFEQGAELAKFADFPVDDSFTKTLDLLEEKIQNVLGRVFRDRPLLESADFFKGFSRGLRSPVTPLVPKVVDGKPIFTPRQFKLMSTLVIYSAIVNHWREIDELKSSAEAYDFLSKLIPAEILGFDPERTRALFGRIGKRFGKPGRPKG